MFDVEVGDRFKTRKKRGICVQVLRRTLLDPVDAAVCREGDGHVFFVTPWMLALGVVERDLPKGKPTISEADSAGGSDND